MAGFFLDRPGDIPAGWGRQTTIYKHKLLGLINSISTLGKIQQERGIKNMCLGSGWLSLILIIIKNNVYGV